MGKKPQFEETNAFEVYIKENGAKDLDIFALKAAGFSQKEIGKMLGISAAAVAQRKSRAKKGLIQWFEEMRNRHGSKPQKKK